MGTPHKTHNCCEPIDSPHASTCCCGFQRRFATKAEQREALESYRTQLQNELTGVKERLDQLND
jgi:hypothetical protein